MNITMKSLIADSDVPGRITKLGANAADVQNEIHLIGCSVLNHVSICGDSTNLVKLFNALPVGQRVKSLAFWVRTFSNGKCNMKLDKKVWSCVLAKKWTAGDFDIAGAIATTFADLTVERDPTTLTVESFVKKLAATANNTAMFDGTQMRKVDPAVNALAAQLTAYVRKLEDERAGAAAQAIIDAAAAAALVTA